LVSAIVTDKSGQRVKDLKASDFTILENGKPQKITAFQFESRGFEGAPKSLSPLPHNIYTNRPEYNMPHGPLTVILLDGINTAVADQGTARTQVLKYLGTQLQPGQRVSVYTLAKLLQAAGAVYGMELDINPDWVSFMSYGGANPANPTPTKLWDFVQPANRYFQPSDRDFVSVYSR